MAAHREEAPAWGDRGSGRKNLGVCRGVRVGPSARKLGRRWRRGLSLLIEPPRVASLFQLRDDVIGNGVSLSFGQPFFQSANDLAGAAKGKGDGVPKDLSSRHVAVEHKENRCASRYILYTAANEPLCGSPAFSLVPTPSGCQACPLVGRCVTFLDVPLIARQAVEGVEIRQPAAS
jgi:hypothetical protein